MTLLIVTVLIVEFTEKRPDPSGHPTDGPIESFREHRVSVALGLAEEAIEFADDRS
jgi:hypothetical protein